MKYHLDSIDLAKGIGIMLVLLGHGMFPWHFLIASFHMPLFFILAGITFTPPYHIIPRRQNAGCQGRWRGL